MQLHVVLYVLMYTQSSSTLCITYSVALTAILDGKYTVCSWLSTYVCQLADISPRHQHLWCYFYSSSLVVAIDIANVHLGLWSSSHNSVACFLVCKITNQLLLATGSAYLAGVGGARVKCVGGIVRK